MSLHSTGDYFAVKDFWRQMLKSEIIYWAFDNNQIYKTNVVAREEVPGGWAMRRFPDDD